MSMLLKIILFKIFYILNIIEIKYFKNLIILILQKYEVFTILCFIFSEYFFLKCVFIQYLSCIESLARQSSNLVQIIKTQLLDLPGVKLLNV